MAPHVMHHGIWLDQQQQPLDDSGGQSRPLLAASCQLQFFNVVSSQGINQLQDFLAVYASQIELDAVDPRTGFTALSYCSREGSVPKTKRLLKMGAEPSKLDLHGYMCLHYAMAFGHQHLVQFLLENDIC